MTVKKTGKSCWTCTHLEWANECPMFEYDGFGCNKRDQDLYHNRNLEDDMQRQEYLNKGKVCWEEDIPWGLEL